MNSPVVLLDPINNSHILIYMSRRTPEDILKRAIARTRQAQNAQRVLNKEFSKLPLAQRREIARLKHRGFTTQDLADHDFNYTIGDRGDYSGPSSSRSASWNLDTYEPATSVEWESIDLNSQAPSSYYAAGERPRWNLSRIASGTDEAFAADEAVAAGEATSEFGPEIAVPVAADVYIRARYPKFAAVVDALQHPDQAIFEYGANKVIQKIKGTHEHPYQQVYNAPAQAGVYPADWASLNHGNTQFQPRRVRPS